MTVVTLRPVEDSDLDALFAQMRDPVGVRMAAFTPENPDDRHAFDAHMARPFTPTRSSASSRGSPGALAPA